MEQCDSLPKRPELCDQSNSMVLKYHSLLSHDNKDIKSHQYLILCHHFLLQLVLCELVSSNVHNKLTL